MESYSFSLGVGGLFPHQKDPLPPLGRTDAGRPAADAHQPSASRGLGARPRFSPSSGARTPPGRPAPLHACPLPKRELGARALVPARVRRTDGAQPPLPRCTPALCPARAGSAGPAPRPAQVR